MLVKHLMMKDVVTTTTDVTVKTCIELLSKRHVGSIVIVNETGRCLGIFTERDAIRIIAQNVPLDVPIEKVMTKKIFTISEDATFQEVKTLINLHGIRHLPVVDSNEELVGLISVRQIFYDFFGM